MTQHREKGASVSTQVLNLPEKTTYTVTLSFSGRTLARKGRHHGNSSDRAKADATDQTSCSATDTTFLSS